MINPESLHELRNHLETFRSDYLVSPDPEVVNGCKIIDSTVQDLIKALEGGDWKKARYANLGLSRQTSDAFYMHPASITAVFKTIHKLLQELPKL